MSLNIEDLRAAWQFFAYTCGRLVVWRFYFSFCPVGFGILALFSPSLPVETQIRGHMAGPPPPSPLREKISELSSLVDSRRIVPGPRF